MKKTTTALTKHPLKLSEFLSVSTFRFPQISNPSFVGLPLPR